MIGNVPGNQGTERPERRELHDRPQGADVSVRTRPSTTPASGARSTAAAARFPSALFLIVLLAVGSYLAYTKDLPFIGGGTEVKATFQNATTLRTTSPVRVAGVNVGTVTAVEAEGDAPRSR